MIAANRTIYRWSYVTVIFLHEILCRRNFFRLALKSASKQNWKRECKECGKYSTHHRLYKTIRRVVPSIKCSCATRNIWQTNRHLLVQDRRDRGKLWPFWDNYILTTMFISLRCIRRSVDGSDIT